MTCEACQEAGPIYEAGCPGCEARALALMEEKPQNNQRKAMTPLEIEILLKSYYSPEPLVCFFSSSASEDAIRHFKEVGLLDSEGRATDMGRAHVQQMCNLPYPRQGWFDGHGALILEGS